MEKPIPPNPDTMTDEEFERLIRGSESPLFFLYMFSLSPYEKMHR